MGKRQRPTVFPDPAKPPLPLVAENDFGDKRQDVPRRQHRDFFRPDYVEHAR